MKKSKISLWILAAILIIISVESCVTEEVIITDSNINNIKLNVDVYNNLKSNATAETSSEVLFNRVVKQFISQTLLSEARADSEDWESLVISSSVLSIENLNDIFNEEATSIIGLTLFKETESELVSGIAIHHQEVNDTNIKLYVYNSISEENFERISMDAKRVSEFTYDQLFYISKEFFPGRDMETLVVENINDYAVDDKIDDFAIIEVVSRLGGNNNYRNFEISSGIDEYIDDGGKACGVVPLCWSGGPNTYCAPFAQGCRVKGGCARISVSERFSDSNLNTEQSEFESTLPNQLLYNLKDNLDNYKVGKFLVESYYSVSKQFNETLDTELLLKILIASPKLKELVDAFLENNGDYTFTEEVYSELVAVINMSITKSQNKVYIDFMSKLMENLETFKGKNINQIKTLLIPIE